jgi:hypothetical protein
MSPGTHISKFAHLLNHAVRFPYMRVKHVIMEAEKSTNEVALEATVTYLEGLPTGTSTKSAIDNISGWEQKLREGNKPEWNTIADELNTLKKLLTSGSLEGKPISQSLIRLGELTRQTALNADKSIADDLQKLGGWLIKIGKSITNK